MLPDALPITNTQVTVCNAAELVRRGMTALAYARKKKRRLLITAVEIEPNSLNLRLLNDFQTCFIAHSLCCIINRNSTWHDNEITHIEALIRWPAP